MHNRRSCESPSTKSHVCGWLASQILQHEMKTRTSNDFSLFVVIVVALERHFTCVQVYLFSFFFVV